jgi:hypothetical protein
MTRQYTGTTWADREWPGRVFLAYAGPAGDALVDRELYLPRC